MLGIVVTDALYRAHPDLPEGQLAKLRASVVNMRALADVARGIGPDGLGAYLLLGRGEEATGGRDKSSILADTLEALLGAVYLEHGLRPPPGSSTSCSTRCCADAATAGAGLDWKTSLQELTAERGLGVPDYVMSRPARTTRRRSPRSARWPASCSPRRTGRSKKEAEQPPPRPPGGRSSRAGRRRVRLEPREPTEPSVPELPEVETVRAGLQRWVAGRTDRRPSRSRHRARSAATSPARPGLRRRADRRDAVRGALSRARQVPLAAAARPRRVRWSPTSA